MISSPGGATLPENVLFVDLDFVTLQQTDELIFKRHFAMMLFLILDVSNHGVEVRGADAERAVAFLPGESTLVFVHPF